MSKFKATLIGTLPPLRQGVYLYCFNLYSSLTIHEPFEFFSFKRLYPKFLYPGNSTFENESNYVIQISKNVKIKSSLTYYNPFSWLFAGFFASSKVIHLQWWITYLTPIYLVIIIAAKIRRKKIVITMHNILPHERRLFDVLFTRMVVCFADKIIVHSNINKQQAEKQLKISPRKIIVIPHGVLDQGDNNIGKESSRKKLGIPINSKIVLFFGTIRNYKGLDTLINAMRIVVEHDPNTLLLICGKSWIDWQQFQNIIEKNGLEKHICLFIEYIPDTKLKYYFNAADLVVAPYKKSFTGQSATGLTAIAFNKPLIVSNAGGLPELVLDENSVFEADDEMELGEKINEVLDDPSLLNKLSEDSKVLRKEYSWDSIAKKTIELYDEMLCE